MVCCGEFRSIQSAEQLAQFPGADFRFLRRLKLLPFFEKNRFLAFITTIVIAEPKIKYVIIS